MTRTTRDRLFDVVQAARDIGALLNRMQQAEFVGDRVAIKAVTLDLMVIGEATNHLPADIRQRHPAIPWLRIRGLRNLIAHEYFVLDPMLIWMTATDALPALLDAAQAELDRLTPSP